jgi:hypothetical protein
MLISSRAGKGWCFAKGGLQASPQLWSQSAVLELVSILANQGNNKGVLGLDVQAVGRLTRQ